MYVVEIGNATKSITVIMHEALRRVTIISNTRTYGLSAYILLSSIFLWMMGAMEAPHTMLPNNTQTKAMCTACYGMILWLRWK